MCYIPEIGEPRNIQQTGQSVHWQEQNHHAGKLGSPDQPDHTQSAGDPAPIFIYCDPLTAFIG